MKKNKHKHWDKNEPENAEQYNQYASEENENEDLEQQEELNENDASQQQEAENTEEQLRDKIAELEDKNLRMMAEFDNFRRRSNKEKLELLSTAGEKILCDMLPLVDDFERANLAMEKTDDINALREGITLIYQKFVSFLEKNDVHPIPTENVPFDTDKHEAVTTFPTQDESQKGKIIDCVQKGYTLGEKVIRYAKVVVGE